MKAFIATLALCIVASGASAEILTCKQTRLSMTGFKNAEAARSWFPKTFKIQIDGEDAVSDFYGLGTATESKGRKKVSFISATSTNLKTEVKFTFIEKTSIYTAKLAGKHGYQDIPGAKGKCRVSN